MKSRLLELAVRLQLTQAQVKFCLEALQTYGFERAVSLVTYYGQRNKKGGGLI